MLDEYVKVIPMLTVDSSQRWQTRVKELEAERSQEMIELRALKKEMAGIKYLLGYSNKPTALLNHLEKEAWRRIEIEEEERRKQEPN
jgi:hypothetical protein